VPKALWGSFLFGAGNSGGSEENRGNFDPYVQRVFSQALSTGLVSDDGLDYFGYHGMNYFCQEEVLATGQNGDDGTIDTAGNPYDVDFEPLPPGRVHAVFWQGMRDTLFNFSEAYQNYSCLRALGGDVRLLSYQSGHNTLQVVPDPDGAPESTIGTCGPTYDPTSSAIAYFDLYLKGAMLTSTDGERAAWQATLDQVLPPSDQICVSLLGTDAVLVNQAALPVGASNTTEFALADTVITTGTSPATAVPVDWDLARDGEIIAGMAQLDISVTPVCEITNTCVDGGPNRIVIFAGLGVNRNGQWQLIDNQVLPIRNTGPHSIELVGVGERLGANEQLGVMLYGRQEQFLATGSDNAEEPTFVPVTVSGTVSMPLLQAADVTLAE
jgi:ABC-2 type transport system ATP-binding protein